jgi:hypothetical protein
MESRREEEEEEEEELEREIQKLKPDLEELQKIRIFSFIKCVIDEGMTISFIFHPRRRTRSQSDLIIEFQYKNGKYYHMTEGKGPEIIHGEKKWKDLESKNELFNMLDSYIVLLEISNTKFGDRTKESKVKIAQKLNINSDDPLGKWKIFKFKYPVWTLFTQMIATPFEMEKEDGRSCSFNLWLSRVVSRDGPRVTDGLEPVDDDYILLEPFLPLRRTPTEEERKKEEEEEEILVDELRIPEIEL